VGPGSRTSYLRGRVQIQMLLLSQIGIWKAKLSESEPLAPVIRKRCELQYIAVFFGFFITA